MSHLTYAEAGVIGLLQGITELFPVSSLGHAVLIPAIIGGQWAHDLDVSTAESPYLAYIVGLHVATATAMIIYFWRTGSGSSRPSSPRSGTSSRRKRAPGGSSRRAPTRRSPG